MSSSDKSGGRRNVATTNPGAAASSREGAELVHKWEEAIDELKQLTREHRKLKSGNPSPSGVGRTAHFGTSSEAPSSPAANESGSHHLGRATFNEEEDMVLSVNGDPHRMGKHGDLVINSEGASTTSQSLAASPTNAQRNRVSKAAAAGNRATRDAFYKSYLMTQQQRREVASKTAAAADHFAAAAVALSALLGGKRGDPREHVVTVEDIFFAAEVPLTYLQQRSIELEELNDVVSRFVETDSRFRGHFAVEVVHLDVAPAVGHVTRFDSRLVGEHACKVTQPRLLEKIKDDLAGNDAVYIVHCDPFVLEQEMRRGDEVDDDDDEESGGGDDDGSRTPKFRGLAEAPPAMPMEEGEAPAARDLNATMGSTINASVVEMTTHKNFVTMPTVNDQNDGLVTIITNWRQKVLDTIQLAEAASFGGKVIGVSQCEVPFPALFKAMGQPSRGSGRARGYLRVFRMNDAVVAASNPEDDPVIPFVSLELMSGNVIGHLDGTSHASAVQPIIAPHLVATAWGLHILNGTVDESHHRHGTGLPIADMVRTLRLPASVYLDVDLSLDQVHLYLCEYLRMKELEGPYNAELVPVVTKANRSDAVPSLTQHELDAILWEVAEANGDPEYPAVAVLFQYDAAVGHNALGVTGKSQWGVLCGYDRDRQLARIIDANAKTFGRSWSVTCEWLLQAVTGYGYIVMRHVSRLLRRQSTRGSASMASSMRVGTAQGLADRDDADFGGEADAWTPKASTAHQQQVVAPAAARPTSDSDDQLSRNASTVTGGPVSPTRARGTRSNSSRQQIGALRHVGSDVRRRLDIASSHRDGIFDTPALLPTFYFPETPLATTCIAAAITRLGHSVQIDDILIKSSFGVNDLISKFIGLNSFKVIADDFLEAANLASQFEVLAVHVAESDHDGELAPTARANPRPPLRTVDQLLRLVEKATDPKVTAKTCLIAHFSSQRITIMGGAHPFGSYGVVTGLTHTVNGETLVDIADMNPNAFLRHWKVSPDVLFDAMETRSFRGHRTRGFINMRTLAPDGSEVEARISAMPKRFRTLSLSAAPFFSVFRTTISPQVYGLSLAFAQLGFSFSPDELFYEAYLKTVRSGTRRSSQARAWKDVEVSFDVLNRNITPKLLSDLAVKFLNSRNQRGLSVEHVSTLTTDNFDGELQDAATPDTDSVLLLTYDVQIVHGLEDHGNGTAIVQSYDAETQMVGLFDAEHATYGLQWRCPLAPLMDAVDKATGASDGVMSAVRVKRVDVPSDVDSEEEGGVAPEITGQFNSPAF